MASRCAIGAEAPRVALAERLAAMQAQVAAVAAADPDGIHDLRVASRRVVAVLGQLDGVLPEPQHGALRDAVRAVTRLLGRARELDVMIAQLARYAKDKTQDRAPLEAALEALRARRAAAAQDCAAAVASVQGPGFAAAASAALEALDAGGTCYLGRAAQHLRRPYKRLRRAYRAWRDTHDEDALHDARIAFKKFRYACEMYAGLYGGRMERFLRDLKKTQDLLGHWNDCRILRDELLDVLAAAPPEQRPGIAAIAARAEAEGAQSREAFERDAAGFFSKGAREETKAMIARPRIDCCKGCPRAGDARAGDAPAREAAPAARA